MCKGQIYTFYAEFFLLSYYFYYMYLLYRIGPIREEKLHIYKNIHTMVTKTT